MAEKLLVPVYLPAWLHRSVVKLKRVFIAPTPIVPTVHVARTAESVDVSWERDVEWSFLSREMPDGPGEAIEFGCEHGYMSLMAAQKGFRVLATDLQEQSFPWRHPLVEFRKGDFLEMDLVNNYYDLAINCSSVEHVGLSGRYGITTDLSDGDLMVMQRLADVLKPNGLLLMTAPCGRDTVMAPWNRVYGPERLPRLLARFRALKESYWIKDNQNRWVECSGQQALDFVPIYDAYDAHRCAYALGCFVLEKSTWNPGPEGR